MTKTEKLKQAARNNAVTEGKRDPTRTLILRSRFAAEATRRFRAIKKLITESIVANDALGLKGETHITNAALPSQQFAFKSNPDKVKGFMSWLHTEVNAEILQLPGGERAVTGNVAWANTYIDSAYKRGMKRADTELAKAGVKTSRLARPGEAGLSLETAFNLPVHADKVGLIYTRVYSDLKGISDSMEQTISRELAQGLADGKGPIEIARELNNAIEKQGGSLAIVDSAGRPMRAIQRAKILARTEVIRAHHVAMVNSYREAGLEGVKVLAEFSTAGDERVCQSCEGLEGLIFTLEKIENLIPVHPQCRCVALPYIGEVGGEGWKEVEEGVWEKAGAVEKPRTVATPQKKPATKTASPKKSVRENIIKEERGIRSGEKETLIAFDQEGKEIFRKTGGQSSISFTKDEMKVLKNADVVTHNHPGRSAFSLEDVNLQIDRGISQMRVATINGTVYTMDLAPSVKGFSSSSAFASSLKSSYKNYNAKAFTKFNKLFKSGELSATQAGINHHEWVWEQVVKQDVFKQNLTFRRIN